MIVKRYRAQIQYRGVILVIQRLKEAKYHMMWIGACINIVI